MPPFPFPTMGQQPQPQRRGLASFLGNNAPILRQGLGDALQMLALSAMSGGEPMKAIQSVIQNRQFQQQFSSEQERARVEDERAQREEARQEEQLSFDRAKEERARAQDQGATDTALAYGQALGLGTGGLSEIMKLPQGIDERELGILRPLYDAAKQNPEAARMFNKLFVELSEPEKAPTTAAGGIMQYVPGQGWQEIPGALALRTRVAEAGRAPSEGTGAGGPFAGTGMQQQAANVLLTGNPDSAEYAIAWASLYGPKTIVDPATGRVTEVTPAPPKGFKPPTAKAFEAAESATSAPAPGESATTTPAGSTITTVTPGQRQPTESEGKAIGFYNALNDISPHMEELEQETTKGYVGEAAVGMLPGGQFLQSPKFREWKASAWAWASQYTYAVSGAQAPEAEVLRNYQIFIPQPQDDKGTISRKRELRKEVMKSLRERFQPIQRPGASGGQKTPGAESGGVIEYDFDAEGNLVEK